MAVSWSDALEALRRVATSARDASFDESKLERLKQRSTHPLPESYLAFLRLVDNLAGHDAFGDFELFGADQVLALLRSDTDEEVVDPDTAGHWDRRIRRTAFSSQRVPIAHFNGDVWLYLDFAPTRAGKPGQVIQVDPEGLSWYWIAASFEDLLVDLSKGRNLDPDLGTQSSED